jgi:hypothetical protein
MQRWCRSGSSHALLQLFLTQHCCTVLDMQYYKEMKLFVLLDALVVNFSWL